jgi:hypothetical protein
MTLHRWVRLTSRLAGHENSANRLSHFFYSSGEAKEKPAGVMPLRRVSLHTTLVGLWEQATIALMMTVDR